MGMSQGGGNILDLLRASADVILAVYKDLKIEPL